MSSVEAWVPATYVGRLVKEGKITPAVREKLQPVLIGRPGKRNIRMLALDSDGKSVADRIIEALRANDVVQLGEQTGVQVLARPVPGKSTGEQDEAITKEMIELAGGAAKTAAG